jgi:cell division protein FtsW (lipid II flippase)
MRKENTNLPGATLLKAAAAVFDRDTVERILTPAISDMQQEWLEAMRAGKSRAATAARLRGYLDFARTALAISAIQGAGKLQKIPLPLVLGPMALAGLGVFWIRAAGVGGGDPSIAEGAGAAFYYKMQAAYLGAGILLMAVAALVPVRRIARTPFRWALLGAAVLGATLAFGIELDGARRWISIAGLKVLPGELMKPLFLVAAAGCLAGLNAGRPARPLPSALAIGALFAIPIALQPDPALVAVLLVSLGAMGIAAGGTAGRRAAIALPCAALAGIALRFGSLPESAAPFGDRHTDFIGRVIVEQAGLWGVALVAALMTLTLASMRSAAKRGGDRLAQVIAAGASAMWISQAAIHLGGALGVLPMTGISLPLLSYGGSSVVSFFLTLGLLAGASIPPHAVQSRPTTVARDPGPTL